jgi:hypothetical protein
MKTPLVIVCAVAALSSPTLAQTTPPASPQQQAEQAAQPAQDAEAERVRCRNVFTVNSRIPERICRTNAEWERIQRETREALDRNQRGAGASGDNTGS